MKDLNKSTLKSIVAVLAGFIAVLVLSIGTDVMLEKTGVFPPISQGFFITWMLLLALIYRTIYAIVGGYVTATLAPDRPMRHAMILGIIGFVFAVLGSIANSDKSTASTAWYPILLIVLTIPSVWLGGKLRTRNNLKMNEKKENAITEN